MTRVFLSAADCLAPVALAAALLACSSNGESNAKGTGGQAGTDAGSDSGGGGSGGSGGAAGSGGATDGGAGDGGAGDSGLPQFADKCTTPSAADGGAIASAAAVWSKRLGSEGLPAPGGWSQVASDPSGNAVLAGRFAGTLNLGGADLVGAAQGALYVARLGADGAHKQSASFAATGKSFASRVATDSTGAVIIWGSFDGSIDFGGGSLGGSGEYSYLVKLAADGSHVWSKTFSGSVTPYQVVIGPGDSVRLVGAFGLSASFGGPTLKSAGDQDILLVELDAAGNHVSSRRFGTEAAEYGNGVAVDPNTGDVVVLALVTWGAVDFGGGPLSAPQASEDIAVVRFKADGTHLWSRRLGGSKVDRGYAIALDSSGRVWIGAAFEGSTQLGSCSLTSADESDGLLVRLELDGAIGRIVQIRGDGGAPTQLVVDGAGNLFGGGSLGSSLEMGGVTLTGSYSPGSGHHDAYIARFDGEGTPLWARAFAGINAEIGGYRVAARASGAFVVGGYGGGPVDLGGGPLAAVTASNLFAAAFSP